ncbi:ATP-binding protein [Clostridium sp. C2-6-12]|uniref:ATP-binding protein n=1 Tax=Clostridium sp. C2-6-12 TaxID=2698832 RepID=UPI00136AE35A|nr:ATP-binding protein [Clostridium sp. C2-6-12]
MVIFSNENGVIELRTEEKDNSVSISAIDNGIGIDKSYIEDIWGRYYKNKESGGMGIGLAICSEILKLHNFQYGVISEKGEMTEFYFIVPKIKKYL